ncbi:MAG: hypothetical protein NE330_12145 [Lentisphaeraceae bacterium]|nr:hypothetical protein [Lentisphaeraceae bacterium]
MYKDRFKEALLRTEAFDCIPPKVEFENKRLLSKVNIQGIVDSLGGITPDDLIVNCLEIHTRIMEPLKRTGIENYFTIGYISVGDSKFFYNDEPQLQSLMNGECKSVVDIHAWLTLPSMEIIDLSFCTSYGSINNDDRFIGRYTLSHADELQGIKYVPMIVGIDFLQKIGAAQL